MNLDELLKHLDKDDLSVALGGGVLGFAIDAIFFATTGLPPGTVAGLSAAGSVALRYFAKKPFRWRTLSKRAKNLALLLKKDDQLVYDELEKITRMWHEKILDNSTFELRMNDIIKRYLEKKPTLSETERPQGGN